MEAAAVGSFGTEGSLAVVVAEMILDVIVAIALTVVSIAEVPPGPAMIPGKLPGPFNAKSSPGLVGGKGEAGANVSAGTGAGTDGAPTRGASRECMAGTNAANVKARATNITCVRIVFAAID